MRFETTCKTKFLGKNGIILSNRYNELSCYRSLIYGNIDFGDDELN